jgi:hypothetical protein
MAEAVCFGTQQLCRGWVKRSAARLTRAGPDSLQISLSGFRRINAPAPNTNDLPRSSGKLGDLLIARQAVLEHVERGGLRGIDRLLAHFIL